MNAKAPHTKTSPLQLASGLLSILLGIAALGLVVYGAFRGCSALPQALGMPGGHSCDREIPQEIGAQSRRAIERMRLGQIGDGQGVEFCAYVINNNRLTGLRLSQSFARSTVDRIATGAVITFDSFVEGAVERKEIATGCPIYVRARFSREKSLKGHLVLDACEVMPWPWDGHD